MAFLFLVLPGCADRPQAPPAILAEASATQANAYQFTAQRAGEAYEWDFGDYSPHATTRSTSHAYAFANGTVTVRLTVTDGGEEATFTAPLVLGDGTNRAPAFILDVSTDWVNVGEDVTLSAAGSKDPDGDPLRFAWSCMKVRDIGLRPYDDNRSPPPVASDPARPMLVRVGAVALPPAQHGRAEECASIGQGMFASLDTLAVSFPSGGLFAVTLLATDGKVPPVAGQAFVYVSPPGEKPDARVSATLDGTFLGGYGGRLQQAAPARPAPANHTLDNVTHEFLLPFPPRIGWINLTYDPGPANANILTWDLALAGRTVAQGGADTLGNGTLVGLPWDGSSYALTIRVEQGADVSYSVTYAFLLALDPTKVYEGPPGIS